MYAVTLKAAWGGVWGEDWTHEHVMVSFKNNWTFYLKNNITQKVSTGFMGKWSSYASFYSYIAPQFFKYSILQHTLLLNLHCFSFCSILPCIGAKNNYFHTETSQLKLTQFQLTYKIIRALTSSTNKNMNVGFVIYVSLINGYTYTWND